ncbi:MAG: tetratricopeptide repeat protein [Acidobacteriota bacterium]
MTRLCLADSPATGSKVCAECHAEIARKYSRTHMAVSSGVSGSGLFVPKFDKASFTDRHSVFGYSVGKDADGYYFRFQKKGDQPSTRRLPYFVGSGAAASAFLIAVNGFLYQSPVTWYSRSASWNLSPGYQNYSYPFLTRAIAPGCLDCHASGLQKIPGTQNGYASPPFLEGGVGCERCHGPGAAHVARMRAGGQGSPAILNPARMKPELRDSVCAQCHLSGVVRIDRPGSEHKPFVPGEDFGSHGTAFVRAGDFLHTRVTSHVENLAQSACKKSSGDRMWCGTCHDPHTVPSGAARTSWFREKCLACHAVKDCGAPQSLRAAKQDSCIACHMPRNATVDAEHVVQTDHSIPRRLTPRAAPGPAADAALVPFGKKTASDRDLGLAYAIVAIREQNKIYAGRAFGLLKKALEGSPDDPLTLSYLADLYKKQADDANAVRLYERLLRADPLETSAPVALGAYAMERGDFQTAIRLWSDALRKSPALLLVRVNLAAALIRTGRVPEARAILITALEFNPGFKAAQDLLETLRAKAP